MADELKPAPAGAAEEVVPMEELVAPAPPPDGAGHKQSRYERYMEEISEDITNTVDEFGCQPILFVGSGLAKRYMNAPSWEELLAHLAARCSEITKGFGFYKQSMNDDPIKIGEEFARLYQVWAWDKGHNEFPEEMFADGVNAQAYIKYKIAEHLRNIQPADTAGLRAEYQMELEALSRIKPHAVVTTNYDQMLEMLFPDHQPIIGQQILKGQQFCVGEIYKIHGCVSDHTSIVFTQKDYDEFAKKKKYLSSKLMTFFSEHPLIFIGYKAGDPNIRAILSDIDEALPEKGGVIPNVYILEWNSKINDNSWPAREKIIPTDGDREVRVKLIQAADFTWVFDAFAATPALQSVNPKVLRSLIARSYELVRHDIPKMTVHADFQMLSSSVENQECFAKLFGLATVNDFSLPAVQHPYSPTEFAKKMGMKHWVRVNELINQIAEEKGVNIKLTDNRYHRATRHNKTVFHAYSDEAAELLKKVKNGEPYELDLGIPDEEPKEQEPMPNPAA